MLHRFVLSAGVIAMAAIAARGICAADRAGPASNQPDVSDDSSSDRRDVMAMLDDGPLHLRMHFSLSGVSLKTLRESAVERLMRSLDVNGDGMVVRWERDHSPLFVRDPRIAAAEAALDPSDRDRIVTRAEILQAIERIGGETVVYRQDSTAGNNDREVFNVLDINLDGTIEESEMQTAANRIGQRDQDEDECVTFEEFLPPKQEEEMLIARPGGSQRRRNPTASDLLRDVNEPLLASRLIRKYDRDGDRQLSAEELGWSSTTVATLDENRNLRLDQKELARVRETPPDLELAVELNKSAPTGPYLKLLATTGQREDQGTRADFARLSFSNAAITLSFRETDPIPDAIANATQTFRRLDLDSNGYLDRKETDDPARFRRGLFDEIDMDRDGRIFTEELTSYVTARAEPATTSSVVTVYDLGYGLYQALDRNGDGRISIREMRLAQQTLKNLRRNQAGGLAQNEGVRRFHIEVVRGSYQLFGRPQEYFAALPTYEQRPVGGPIWFQRMDRNSDGDLTWNEFLGPRDVFDRLDADADGLIDPAEAEKADKT